MLFRVDTRNLVRNQLYLSKEYHIAPSEVLMMTFFEYEDFISNVKEIQKKEEEQRKKDEQQQRMSSPKMPAMPKMPSVSMPKVSIPKF